MPEVERYGRGSEAADVEPGDFILAHRHHVIAWLISVAQRRRFRGRDAPYAHWSHTALVVARDGSLVEAEPLGVVRSPLMKYRDQEYHLVRLGKELDSAARLRCAAYAERQVGQAFGYLALVGAGCYLLFGWPLRLMRRNHQICSGLVVRALQQGGLLAELDPDLVLPADLARRFQIAP
jgi:hypothetical protein